MDNMDYYGTDFESAMLEDSVAYYSGKADSGKIMSILYG